MEKTRGAPSADSYIPKFSIQKSTLGIRLFSPLGYVASLHQSKAGSLLTVSDTCFGKPGIQTGQPTAVCWAESVRNRTEERWQDGPGFAGSHVTF